MFCRVAAALALVLFCAGCGSTGEMEETDLSDYEGQEFAGETFEEYDDRRDSYDGKRGTFQGDDCTEDCSGHEAGSEWAAKNEIEDPDQCGGTSWSFEEGCRAYAEEHAKPAAEEEFAEEVEY